MFQSDTGNLKTESQIRKSTENDIPRNAKRTKTDDSFSNDIDIDKSVENIKTELNEELYSETLVKIEQTELDEDPIINIKTELYEDEHSESLLKPLIDHIKTEQEEDLNLKPIFYSSEKRSNAPESPHEIPDSLFEPLENPVKTKQGKFTCEHCQKVLASSSGLGAHLRRIHSVERLFTCEQCGLEFPNDDRLKSHLSSQHGTKKVKEKIKLIKCPHCFLKFERQSGLVTHINQLHKKKSQQHFCLGCGLGFSNASTLMVHSVYEQKLVKLPCEICQSTTEVKFSCELEKAFKDSGSKVRCKDCTDGQTPASANKVSEVSTKVYSPNKNCEPKPIHNRKMGSRIMLLQGEDENREEIMKSKIKVDQGEDGVVKYCCMDCEYIANTPSIIKIHVEAKHLPPGEYPCQECDKVCTTRNKLMIHNSHQHNSRTRQHHPCKECNYVTNKSTNLKRHVETKHLPCENFPA